MLKNNFSLQKHFTSLTLNMTFAVCTENFKEAVALCDLRNLRDAAFHRHQHF